MLRSKLILVSGFLLAALASPNVHAAQYARPDADLTPAGWTAVPPGALWATVDDPFVTLPDEPRDTSDYINSGNASNSTVILGLSDVFDPGVDTGHVLRYTCQSTGGSKKGEGCDAALYQGDALIATTPGNTATRGAFGQHTLTIPDTQAALITDYTALRVRITPADLDTNESIQVAWIELELPDPAITAPTVTFPTFASVTHESATLGGTMDNDNGTPVTDCGVEWGTSQGGPYQPPVSYDPGPSSNCASNGDVFTANVTGLPANTTIYFRAWATNGVIGYSGESSFPTPPAPTAPTVTADPVTVFDQTSATIGGTITDTGGADPTACGLEWGDQDGGPWPNIEPVDAAECQLDNPFSVSIQGLSPGTPYYFRAYATNTAGTGYSGQATFTTLPGAPTVTTPTVIIISATEATLGGTLASNGGETPSGCGVEWGDASSTGGNYNLGSQAYDAGNCANNGDTFTANVTGLPTGTLVYYRAYATNTGGTAYSSEDSFTPVGPPVVTTDPVTTFDSESAFMGGNVTSDGGSPVTARGVVWDTVSPPEAGGTFVPLGSGTGTFSQNVLGLPASTPIFVKAYAENSVDRTYGAQETFTTLSLPEPTVQATNVVFTRVSGRAFTIEWTRGNGEGSIVVLRLQATGKTDPSDGNDYTPEPDLRNPPTEIPVSSGNYVVHKGPESRVWVTGLALDTTYSVTVYEYSNSGTATDYLLTPPAVGSNEGTQATGTVSTHNEDNRVDCVKCHYHGSFNARDTAIYDVCYGCHNSLGDASAKLEFANHLEPISNPDVDFVDCGVCHDLHLGGTTHTVSTHPVSGETLPNKSFVRANVNKYIPTAAPPAYLHDDEPGHADPEALANTPDRAVEGGTGGYCQVCHTYTTYHRNTVSPDADQCHNGFPEGNCGVSGETHCGACHRHNNQFIGVGGSTTCLECHDQVKGPRPIITTQFDRLSKHISGGSAVVTQPDCLVCHDQAGHPGDQKVSLVHADTGAVVDQPDPGPDNTLASGQGEAYAPVCLSCHDSDGATRLDSLDPAQPDQTSSSPFTGSGAPAPIDAAEWSGAGHNRPTSGNPSGTHGPNPVTCLGDGTNGCHGSGHGSNQNSLLAPADGGSVSATDFCYTCHDSDGPSSKNIVAQFNNGTNYQWASQSTALVNQRHDVTALDQAYSSGAVSCKDCHQPHANNSTKPVLNPDSGAALLLYDDNWGPFTADANGDLVSPGDELNPTNPAGCREPDAAVISAGFDLCAPTFEPDYVEFCLVCHDDAPPPGVTMSPGLLNIASSYLDTAGDQHGMGSGSTGGSTSKGGLKYPWVGLADHAADNDPPKNYEPLNCTVCHGAHGSANIHNLKEKVTVAGVVMTLGGTAPRGGVLDEPHYVGSDTYVLPEIEANSQKDHFWGAWCTFCHKMDGHPTKTETEVCNGPHMHGQNGF
jgi:FlaG/FlaF family flagellin (archaellin)